MYEQLKHLAAFPNIKFFKTRYTSFWGSNTILYMLLRGIREILEMEWNFDYVMNISESDFPVRPIEDFEEHLRERNGGNFIAMGKDQMLKFQEGNGLTKTFYNCDDHMYKVGERYTTSANIKLPNVNLLMKYTSSKSGHCLLVCNGWAVLIGSYCTGILLIIWSHQMMLLLED